MVSDLADTTTRTAATQQEKQKRKTPRDATAGLILMFLSWLTGGLLNLHYNIVLSPPEAFLSGGTIGLAIGWTIYRLVLLTLSLRGGYSSKARSVFLGWLLGMFFGFFAGLFLGGVSSLIGMTAGVTIGAFLCAILAYFLRDSGK